MLESVAVALSEPGFLEDVHDLLAVADVSTGAVVDVTVLLLARVRGSVVPQESRQSVCSGGLYDIFHVIKVEPPCPGVRLGSH